MDNVAIPHFASKLIRQNKISEREVVAAMEASASHNEALPSYLISHQVVPREVVYEALRRATLRGYQELPEWDVLLNAPGQPLSRYGLANGTLVLGLRSDLNDNGLRAFVLTTEESSKLAKHASLVTQMKRAGYKVRATLLAEDSNLLGIVRDEWNSTHGTNESLTGDDSQAHEQWDEIIEKAYSLNASDIHLIVSGTRTEVKYRVLGELYSQSFTFTFDQGMDLATSMYNTMVDVGSTTGGFNPRKPQTAVVTRSYSRGKLRLRFSSIPVEPSGVNITLRLIPVDVQASDRLPADLGYSSDQCDALERMFARSSGMILFVGTTGSGKSTSMACNLRRLVKTRPTKLLRTVEEPVEIRIPGASQTSVARSASDTETDNPFINVMRELMRADPDYLMVGEIRDRQTADLAIQAVRSGHLCVSTLHADGAPIAYDRLMGMGIPRADMASVGLVAGLVYQRLVAVLCPKCKVSGAEYCTRHPDAGIVKRLRTYLERKHQGDAVAEAIKHIFFRSTAGCDHCKHRGIVDRTVCAEILQPTADIIDAISEGRSRELWTHWRSMINKSDSSNMTGRTAFEHGLWKMEQGEVSPEDVEREFRFLDEEAFV